MFATDFNHGDSFTLRSGLQNFHQRSRRAALPRPYPGQPVGRSTTAAMLFASIAQAADLYWGVPSGDWSNADNWGGALPTSSNVANISNGGTAIISHAGAVCNSLGLQVRGREDDRRQPDGIGAELHRYFRLG